MRPVRIPEFLCGLCCACELRDRSWLRHSRASLPELPDSKRALYEGFCLTFLTCLKRHPAAEPAA